MVRRKMSGGGITCQKNEYYMEKAGNADFSICCRKQVNSYVNEIPKLWTGIKFLHLCSFRL